MKHQYESEILFRLMERDGFNIPSSVPPYESEIKAYLINQVKHAYPKLTDYEAEWLLYNYTKHLPADFPISSATNVTKATFKNVVPFAYQSAILKGQTLVNLVKQNEATAVYATREAITNGFRYTQQYNSTSMGATRIQWDKETGVNLFKPSTEYYIQCDIKVNKPRVLRVNSPQPNTQFSYALLENESTHIKGTFVTATNSFDYIYFYVCPLEGSNMKDYVDDTFEITNLIIAEYQEGMENSDIPYFEGIQSLKMPVLTTSNGDGTKTNILSTSEEVELRGIGEVQDTLDCLTGELTQYVSEVVLDGTENWIRFGVKDGITLFHLNTNNYHIINFEITCVAPLKTVKYGVYYPNVWEDSTLSLFSNYHQKNKEGIGIFSNKQSVDEFKSWLSQNPLKMVIKLKNPTVKTVELKTVNESGESVHFMPFEGTMHVQSSGEPIQPTFDMSVPVEATTQNLASFIDLEMEE